MVTNIRDLQVRDDLIVTIAGTVVAIREDEFLLQDSTGQIWVDAVRRGSGRINLAIGEQVTVTGDLDDLEDFDAVRITRSDGSAVIGQPFPGNGSGNGRPGNGRPGRPGNGRPGNGRPGNGRPGNGRPDGDGPIQVGNAPNVDIGDLQIRDDFLVTISGTVTQIRDDEFVLRDQTGQVLVDGIRRGSGQLDIAIGERVTVVGDLDDQDFDAIRITRADGSVIGTQPVQSGNRDRNRRPRDRRENDFSGPPPWAGQPGGPRDFLRSTDIVSASEFAVDASIL